MTARTRAHVMRQAAGGAFAIVHPRELAALLDLPSEAARLWLLLLSVIDFDTGAGQGSYAHLAQSMAPPPSPLGGRPRPAFTAQAVRGLVLRLEQCGILERDTLASEQQQRLIFRVAPRKPGAELRRAAGGTPPNLAELRTARRVVAFERMDAAKNHAMH